MQAVEAGANALLIDEDTCATNFMVRDDKMMQLVAPEKEPITPFVRIVRSLYDDKGISTILVVGGVGDYFDVADNVVVMDSYQCTDATERAKQIVARSAASTLPHTASSQVPFRSPKSRAIVGRAFEPNGKVKVASQSTVLYGETELDVSGLEQLVSKSQTAAIASALKRIPQLCKERLSLRELLQSIEQRLDEEGVTTLTPGEYNGGMSRPRVLELAGAINRLRREKSIVQSNT